MESKQTTTLLELTAKTLEKKAHNSHGRYNYAPADDVYSHVRGALLEQGLMIWISEYSTDIEDLPLGKAGAIIKGVKTVFEIGLSSTVDGRPKDTERVAVYNRLDTPQSLLACRTYAIKYFLSSKFLLVSGSQDLDSTTTYESAFVSTPPESTNQVDRIKGKI